MNKSKLNNAFKNFLYAGILFLLFLPMVQQKMKFFKFAPLKGSFSVPEKTYFSSQKWMDGQYQKEKQEYLKHTIGFRPIFIRTYNQIQFSLFNQPRANGSVIGKENYLYEENYILAHLGRDFIGENEIAEKVNKLKKIRDTLRKKNKDIIVLLAPGKGSFFSEYIPERFNPTQTKTTNYEVYRKKISEANIHLLDFHRWFRKMKSTSPYPLFPKTGTHWSKYGEILAADSIIKFINTLRENKIPELIIGNVETSLEMKDTDDDIEKGMNLLYNIEDIPMGYPELKTVKNTDSTTAKVLTVADSYFWGMFNWGISRESFNNGQFWYYNEQIYPDYFTSPLHVKDIDIIEGVEKHDIVILLSTDATLHKFAFGFIDQLYDAYFSKK